MVKFRIYIILCVIGFVQLDPISFQDCGSEYDLQEVDIEGCSELPCEFVQGSKQRVSIKLLSSNHISKRLHQKVQLILRGVHVDVPVTPGDPCMQINCPVNLANNASFSAVIDLTNQNLVSLDGFLYWEIKNDREKKVLCMKTDISVTGCDNQNPEPKKFSEYDKMDLNKENLIS